MILQSPGGKGTGRTRVSLRVSERKKKEGITRRKGRKQDDVTDCEVTVVGAARPKDEGTSKELCVPSKERQGKDQQNEKEKKNLRSKKKRGSVCRVQPRRWGGIRPRGRERRPGAGRKEVGLARKHNPQKADALWPGVTRDEHIHQPDIDDIGGGSRYAPTASYDKGKREARAAGEEFKYGERLKRQPCEGKTRQMKSWSLGDVNSYQGVKGNGPEVKKKNAEYQEEDVQKDNKIHLNQRNIWGTVNKQVGYEPMAQAGLQARTRERGVEDSKNKAENTNLVLPGPAQDYFDSISRSCQHRD